MAETDGAGSYKLGGYQCFVTNEDLALTVHGHPTFGEAIQEAAEDFLGHAIHTVPRKR